MGPLPTDAFPVQVGFTAPSRHFPHATDRNRVKRLGRECWRLQKASLYTQLQTRGIQVAVFFVYTDKKIAGYELLFAKMGSIIERLGKAVIKAADEAKIQDNGGENEMLK